jgi:circadian clock protein KaiB
MDRYHLKLFIAGHTSRSLRAVKFLKETCEEFLAEKYDLEIVDTLEHPEVAEEDKILATPTLIKESPGPLRRIIGDLSNKEKLILALDFEGLKEKQ